METDSLLLTPELEDFIRVRKNQLLQNSLNASEEPKSVARNEVKDKDNRAENGDFLTRHDDQAAALELGRAMVDEITQHATEGIRNGAIEDHRVDFDGHDEFLGNLGCKPQPSSQTGNDSIQHGCKRIRYSRDDLLSCQVDKAVMANWNSLHSDIASVLGKIYHPQLENSKCSSNLINIPERQEGCKPIQYNRKDLLFYQVDEATTIKWNSCHPDICTNFRELYCSKENSKCSSRAKNGSKKQHVSEKFVTSREIFTTDVPPEHGFEALTTSAINEFAKEDEDTYEEDESDDDGTFQQPAFAVDGEPDFESGPPQDGWEYLRRVRWEAAQCPRVKVAKIAPEKLLAEQTSYMPKIASIPSCAPEVLPSKEWENMFLADFSGLRLFLSNFPRSAPIKHFPHFRDQMAWQAFCFGKSNTVVSHEDKGDISNDEMDEHSMQSDEDMESNSEVQDLTPIEDSVETGLSTANQTGESLLTADQTGENNTLQSQETGHQPLMSIILSLDEVSRAALLRYHITWFEDIKSLSEDRVLWIFALAAVVDKPLDPETCASFRTLLRKCAVMRASKEQRSDRELYMLNILITISGRYFGQDDSLN